jgi:hypothetical protein
MQLPRVSGWTLPGLPGSRVREWQAQYKDCPVRGMNSEAAAGLGKSWQMDFRDGKRAVKSRETS